MNPVYLSGVPHQKSLFKGLSIIGGNSDVWYGGAYSFVKSSAGNIIKRDIVKILNPTIGVQSNLEDWDWHHVVEGQHLAILSVNGDIVNQYDNLIPTVLIHKIKHRFLSRNFNNNAFFELIDADKTDRYSAQKRAQQFATTPEGKTTLRKQLKGLKEMYTLAYQGYPTLHRIAQNIFDNSARLLQ